MIPARTSTVWKTVAPTTVTGAIRPMSVTGTISTAIPGLDAVDHVLAGVLAVPEVAGRGDREDRHRAGDEVVAQARKSSIISTIRGTPCSVNAPLTTGLVEFVRTMYSRQASLTWASMSLFVENAVAR